eukprot:TRINITY_DN56929_c0_g1_i1.p1 TRINITY_DN56929_c0_g1~~TRINITY_DN56929_c0_g1_i1.p1  ORF type:complete len:264 (-),score=26.03 TRINITY_DN56929_c0_g1_i1:132-923(-)
MEVIPQSCLKSHIAAEMGRLGCRHRSAACLWWFTATLLCSCAGEASASLVPTMPDLPGMLRKISAWWSGGNLGSAGQSFTEDPPCPMPEHGVEERNVETLEVLLAEERCPFVAAFFSGSSPLAQSTGLALTEQRLASSFPKLRYIRVDADLLSIRAFLQWDISFLPTFVLFWPGSHRRKEGTPEKKWHHWKGEGSRSPYDYHAVADWITLKTGELPLNSSSLEAGPVPERQPHSSGRWQLVLSWGLVALGFLHRYVNWQPLVG